MGRMEPHPPGARRHQDEAQQQAEVWAERLPALMRADLAVWEARLSVWLTRPPQPGVLPPADLLLLGNRRRIEAHPQGRLLYDPDAEAAPEVTPPDLGAVELFEFQPGRAAEAIAAYRRLADSPHLAMRAGALLRMGRINRNQGTTIRHSGLRATGRDGRRTGGRRSG
ncbi:MAG: hypothetical protein IPJ98_20325 [Bryobacterales bacterium]|nr:hypothetical protein [Bryobacterales bacterium]